MTRKVKTAVIGIGNMGRNHVRIYSHISNLVAIADVDSSVGEKVAKEYSVPLYKNYQEMLDKEKPEAISVVVPTQNHREVALVCLERQIPTIVEKPLAANMKDAMDMVSSARKNKTFLMVGHIERFNPAVIRLKRLINEKKLGSIVSVLVVRVGISPPRSLHSDVTFDLAIHDIDVCNYLLDEYPTYSTIIKRKISEDNIADSATVVLKYKHTTAMIQTNWITPIKIRKLYITGTEAYAELDYISQELTVLYKHNETAPIDSFAKFISLSKFPKKKVYISKKEPLREELKFFLKNRYGFNSTYILPAIEALNE